MRLFVTAIALLLLSSCASEENFSKKLMSWQGKPLTDFIQAYGPPTSTKKLDENRDLLTWHSRKEGTYAKIRVPERRHSGGRSANRQPYTGAVTDTRTIGGAPWVAECTITVTSHRLAGSKLVENISYHGNNCKS